MSAPMKHLDEERLLRYVDGELPVREANRARAHLEACWQCRVEFEELQKTIAECVRYRKDIQHFLPSIPSPWADINRRFDEIDRSLDRPNLFERAWKGLRWSGIPRWAPAPIALILIAALIFRLQETPSVQAAELLRKAVVAAGIKETKPRLIQIRTKHQQIRRLAETQAVGASSAESDSLETLFASAHFNWQDPLSAKSYQEWRDQLPAKHDQVSQTGDGYLIKTETSASPLTEATLRLNARDLRPVEEHLQFGSNEWVEVTEVAPEPAVAAVETKVEPDESLRKSPPEPVADASPATVSAPSVTTATAGDELQVLLALHRIGADLGDPIDISLHGSQVLVTGVGIPPRRQQEIRAVLASNSNVTVQFSEPAASTAPAPPPRPEGATNAEISPLQARVAEKLGGRVNFEELSSEVLDLSDQMMSRAYAVRRLSEKFPAGVDASLTPVNRQILAGLRQEHTATLVHLTADIDRVLRPVFVSLGVNPRAGVPETGLAPEWQPATEGVFQSARQVEKLAALMFGAAQGDSSGQQIPAQLATNLAQLRTRLAAYAKIGTEETDRNH